MKPRRSTIIFSIIAFCISIMPNAIAQEKILPRVYAAGKFYPTFAPFAKLIKEGKTKSLFAIKDNEGHSIVSCTFPDGFALSDSITNQSLPDDQVLNREQFIANYNAKAQLNSILGSGLKIKEVGGARSLTIGKPLPNDFTLSDLDGNTWTKASLLGKIVVVNAWYSGCGPCLKEFPILSTWKEKHPDVTFLSVNFQDKDIVSRITKAQGFTWTHIYNDTYFPQFLDGQGYPLFIVLDKDGLVRLVLNGASEDNRAKVLETIAQLKQ